MSRSASIDIELYGQEIKIVDIIYMLLSFGWSLNDNGKVSYLPPGVDDNFEWIHDDIKESNLFSLLKKKELVGELIGIVLTWRDTGIGGQFLLRKDMSISFILSVNRKKISDINIFTDVNWYLEKIIPALTSKDVNIESISWEEHV